MRARDDVFLVSGFCSRSRAFGTMFGTREGAGRSRRLELELKLEEANRGQWGAIYSG
jgi:hypothetical protein